MAVPQARAAQQQASGPDSSVAQQQSAAGSPAVATGPLLPAAGQPRMSNYRVAAM
ncbi:hypothetical protein ACFYO1_28370 [Nocardia sp. NPDC006044]|uniref:hypothetical protein n=1 Tax=Nocardia sp. NPDC006044 TaxID=3364306 RepID=UPI0036CE39D4